MIKLTSLSHGVGCGCKLPVAEVHRIAAALPVPADPNLLVGAGTADDAGVYRLTDELALVQTVDS
ncbi:MAG: selenide, water dikinase SelD, partial [Thermoleophilaceae bacterium]